MYAVSGQREKFEEKLDRVYSWNMEYNSLVEEVKDGKALLNVFEEVVNEVIQFQGYFQAKKASSDKKDYGDIIYDAKKLSQFEISKGGELFSLQERVLGDRRLISESEMTEGGLMKVEALGEEPVLEAVKILSLVDNVAFMVTGKVHSTVLLKDK